MKKRLLLIFLALVLVVSMGAFAACAEEEEAPPVEEWQWPERLLVTASSTRSPAYAGLVAWTTPLSKDTGMTTRVICEADSRLEEQWLKEGRVFTKAPHQGRSMLYATAGYARRDWGPYHSRIWYPAGLSYWSFGTLGDSGIKTPYDIKPGMKATMMTLSEEPQQSIIAVLAWAQVDPEDITFVPLGVMSQNARFIMDGKSDFTLSYHTTPSWYEVEASPHGCGWIELDAENDPEGAARFLEYYPWTSWGKATGGLPTAEGVSMCMNVSPNITQAETDPELVYRVVKWLDENYDRYKDGSPWAATMTIDNLMDMAESNYEPIHDGTVRYLEEKGLWTEELEARRQFNIEQLDLWVKAYQSALDMADDKGIVVDPANEEWQEFWENYRAEKELPMLVYFQGPGKEWPTFDEFYSRWENVKPFKD